MLTRAQLEWMVDAPSEERRYAGEQSFAAFFACYFTHYMKADFAPFHYDMAQDVHDLVSGRIKELGWFMFRESAKTSLSKAFITWCIAYKKFQYINVDSQDKNNAERFLFDVVLELQTNKLLRSDFGELFNAKRTDAEKTQKRITDFLTTTGIRIEAHSTQEPVRGRLHGSTRPQLILLDDFETLATIRSEAATRQVRDHISEFKGGLDQARGRVLYLGNYLSEYGTVQMLIDKAKDDPSMRVRQVWIVGDDGKPSWPAKHVITDEEALTTGKISIEEIKRRMRTPDGGDVDFMREMMGKPFDPSTAKFNASMFRQVQREEVDRMSTAAYLIIDPPGQAYTEASIRKGSGDYIGYALVKITDSGKWMVECWRVRQGPKDMISAMFSIWSSERVVKIGIENTQFYQGIKTLIEEEGVRRGVRLTIQELKHTAKQSKKERILTLLPRYESGSIWHVKDRCGDVEEELLKFPISEFDDASDALAMATEIVERPSEPEAIVSVNRSSANAYRYGSARALAIRNGME